MNIDSLTEPVSLAPLRAIAVVCVATLTLLVGPGGAAAQPEDDAELAATYFESGAVPGSGTGKKVGYISLGEAEPFAQVVTEGIREQARIAGVELVVCDARFDPAEALICARQMEALGAEGIINFQASEADAGRICAAHGNLPTIAVDIEQQPCQRSFVGVDNRLAGRLTGISLGEHLERERDCAYDTVFVLRALFVGVVDTERMSGMVEGFESVCGPIPASRLVDLDVQGGYQTTLEVMSGELPLHDEGIHVVLTVNGSTAAGAADAAASLGRAHELRIGSQGVESIKHEVACLDHWVAAAAYFPERYGHILIPAMIDLLDGKEIPPDLLIPHVSVTSDNIRDIYDEEFDCSS